MSYNALNNSVIYIIILFTLQMRKLRHKKISKFALAHSANRRWRCDWKAGRLTAKPALGHLAVPFSLVILEKFHSRMGGGGKLKGVRNFQSI